MSFDHDKHSRRAFAALAAGMMMTAASDANGQDRPTDDAPQSDAPRPDAAKGDKPAGDAPPPATGPTEAPFERDYPAPDFKPSWKRPQINRLLIQDFVIFAHTDLDMVKKLLDKEPALVLASINWGAGDWESGLNAAAHMGRRDIVELLLERGARIDIFCAAMLGQLDAVKTFLTFQPKLIDAKEPHGFSLHFHAQVGGDESAAVLDYLQSVKKIELKPNPFLKMKQDAQKPAGDAPKSGDAPAK